MAVFLHIIFLILANHILHVLYSTSLISILLILPKLTFKPSGISSNTTWFDANKGIVLVQINLMNGHLILSSQL